MEEGNDNTLDIDSIEMEDEMDVNVPPVVGIVHKSKKYGGKEPRKVLGGKDVAVKEPRKTSTELPVDDLEREDSNRRITSHQ